MYNKSNVMRNAWNIKKTAGVSMSVALKSAWALEKAMMQAEEIAANKLDNARVRVNDWVKNGHNRTYIEVAVYTNAWNRKRTEKIGYVNNLTGEFVAA